MAFKIQGGKTIQFQHLSSDKMKLFIKSLKSILIRLNSGGTQEKAMSHKNIEEEDLGCHIKTEVIEVIWIEWHQFSQFLNKGKVINFPNF